VGPWQRQSPGVHTRQATPERWQQALLASAQLRQTGSGLWIATSGTDGRTAYVVSLHECECPGHEYHGYCKHRALLAWTIGVLTIGAPDPEPPTPVAPAGRLSGSASAHVVALETDAMKRHPLLVWLSIDRSSFASPYRSRYCSLHLHARSMRRRNDPNCLFLA
jgi:hypothetical protein